MYVFKMDRHVFNFMSFFLDKNKTRAAYYFIICLLLLFNIIVIIHVLYMTIYNKRDRCTRADPFSNNFTNLSCLFLFIIIIIFLMIAIKLLSLLLDSSSLWWPHALKILINPAFQLLKQVCLHS